MERTLGSLTPLLAAPWTRRFTGLRIFSDPDDPSERMRIVASEAVLANLVTGQVKRFTTIDTMADLGSSGAGGLDTGSEAASTWYDLYLIGTDGGTVSACYSKGLQWLEDQAYADSNRDGVRALRDNAARTYVAQGFKTATAGVVHSIDVSLLRVGSPTGYLWGEIWSDAAGNPSAIVAGGRSVMIPIDSLDATNRVRMRLVFPEQPTLTATTQYHLVLRGTWTIGAAYVDIGVDASAPGYANGQVKTGDATPTWSAQTEDFALFHVNLLTGSESLTLPSGYTYQGRVSWNRNDGSLNLYRMWQEAGRWLHMALETATTPVAGAAWTFLDYSAYVPSWARELLVYAESNGTAGVALAYPLPFGDPDPSTTSAVRFAVGISGNSSIIILAPLSLSPMGGGGVWYSVLGAANRIAPAGVMLDL